MALYKTAETILCKARRHEGSIKNLIFAADYKNPKQLFALVCETLKHWELLDQIIRESKFSKAFGKNSKELAALLVYDHLFGKGIRCGGKLKFLVIKHKVQLTSSLARIKIRRGVAKDSDLLSANKSVNPPPKYLRINTLLADRETVLEHFKNKGFNLVTGGENLARMELACDDHLDNLLVFHNQLDLHDDPLYNSGKVIIQDKASCIPAQVLNPQPGWEVIDACAAPGNKTSHMAALMQNTGKIFAFDLSSKRLETMEKLLNKAGVTNCISQVQDFLLVDPLDPLYSNVTALLVDPSCSGSGIVSRMNELVDTPNSKLESRLSALAEFQTKVLNHALSFPNAQRIVYSTCSVHNIENENVVQRVLSQNPNFALEKCLPQWHRRGIPTEGLEADEMIRCDPTMDKTNGFFVALLVNQNKLDSTQENKKVKRKRMKNVAVAKA